MTDEADMVSTDEMVESLSENAADDSFAAVSRIVVFYLDRQRYALSIDRVQEIQQIVAFSAVPGGDTGVVGMVNLRGTVIPAIDLRRIVGLPLLEYTLETPMIICRMGEQLVTLIVDEVEDVLEIPDECVQDPSTLHALADKMRGVARMHDGLVYILDIDELLGSVLGGGR